MTPNEHLAKRLAKNAVSKEHAEHDCQTWTSDELEVLALWDCTEFGLADVAEVLGRTLEACRERYHKCRRLGVWEVTRTTTTTTTTATYRGWREGDGDGSGC